MIGALVVVFVLTVISLGAIAFLIWVCYVVGVLFKALLTIEQEPVIIEKARHDIEVDPKPTKKDTGRKTDVYFEGDDDGDCEW